MTEVQVTYGRGSVRIHPFTEDLEAIEDLPPAVLKIRAVDGNACLDGPAGTANKPLLSSFWSLVSEYSSACRASRQMTIPEPGPPQSVEAETASSAPDPTPKDTVGRQAPSLARE